MIAFYRFLLAAARLEAWWAECRLAMLSDALLAFAISADEYPALRARIKADAAAAMADVARWEGEISRRSLA